MEEAWVTKTKKVRQSKSKMKVMLVVFYMSGIIHMESIPEGQIMNQHEYKRILWCLLCDKRWELWENNLWLLHHDNMLVHNTLSIQEFLAEKMEQW